MQDQNKLKNKHILYPILKTYFSTVLTYTIFNWLFVVKYNIFDFYKNTNEVGLPIVFSLIVSVLLIRPRFKVLNLQRKTESWMNFYIFVSCAILVSTLLFSQRLMKTTTGQLTHLKQINDINKFPLTKYYKIDNFFISRDLKEITLDFNVSGKRSTQYNMNIYYVLPIFTEPQDSSNKIIYSWLGIFYKKTISNSLSEYQKQKEFGDFGLECEEDFEKLNFNKIIYFENYESSNEKDFFKRATNYSKFNNNKIILIPKYESYLNKNGDNLKWLILSILIGLVTFNFMIKIKDIQNNELKALIEFGINWDLKQKLKRRFNKIRSLKIFN